MSKYRLHIDETVNILNFIDIETDRSDREIDALLSKIEQGEVTSTLDLKRKLEAQGIKIRSTSTENTAYYRKAETLEIEELEEPKREGIMVKFKACDLNKSIIEQAIEELRAKMNLSIKENGILAAKTIDLSQELDVLIVSHMKKSYKDTDQSSPNSHA